MGAGASKGKNGGGRRPVDTDAEDAEAEADFQRELEETRRQQRANDLRRGAAIGRGPKEGKRRLSPAKSLAPIDSELDDHRDEVEFGDVDDTDEIREIDDLNRTFASIGLGKEGRIGQKKEASSAPTTNAEREREGEDGPGQFFSAGGGSHTRFGPGTSVGRRPSLVNGRKPSLAAGMATGVAGPPPPPRSGRGVKLSWEESGPTHVRESEEWTYTKVNINDDFSLVKVVVDEPVSFADCDRRLRPR